MNLNTLLRKLECWFNGHSLQRDPKSLTKLTCSHCGYKMDIEL